MKLLKKIFLMLLALLICVCASGCKRLQQYAEAGSFSVEETVLLDRDGIIITLNAFEFDRFNDGKAEIVVENNGEEDLYIFLSNTINQKFIYGFSEVLNSEVPAGKKVVLSLLFYEYDELKEYGVNNISTIEFYFDVRNTDMGLSHRFADSCTVKTSAYDVADLNANDEGREMLNKDGLRVVAKDITAAVRNNDSSIPEALCLYIENNTGYMINGDPDVYANDFVVDAWLPDMILPGEKGYFYLHISDDRFEITSAESLDISISFYGTNASDSEFKVDTDELHINLN